MGRGLCNNICMIYFDWNGEWSQIISMFMEVRKQMEDQMEAHTFNFDLDE